MEYLLTFTPRIPQSCWWFLCTIHGAKIRVAWNDPMEIMETSEKRPFPTGSLITRGAP